MLHSLLWLLNSFEYMPLSAIFEFFFPCIDAFSLLRRLSKDLYGLSLHVKNRIKNKLLKYLIIKKQVQHIGVWTTFSSFVIVIRFFSNWNSSNLPLDVYFVIILIFIHFVNFLSTHTCIISNFQAATCKIRRGGCSNIDFALSFTSC